ncbi:uncharacterized protein TNCV_1142211 [Trichonephila clavipes]|nr:uncharacterized protein TNCV_1142211 [Trichonephila clavipes]
MLHPSCLPIPLRNAKQLLMDKYRQKRISPLKELDVGKSWSCLLDGQRLAQLSVLPQVEEVACFRVTTTRYDYLQAHLFKIDLPYSPLCPLCKSVTGKHLFNCPSPLHVLSQDNYGVLSTASAISALYWTARRLMSERTVVEKSQIVSFNLTIGAVELHHLSQSLDPADDLDGVVFHPELPVHVNKQADLPAYLERMGAGHACSHPRVPRAHQAGSSRQSLAGVRLSESVRCHGPGLALLTNGGVQQQQSPKGSSQWLAKLTAVPLGLGSNPGEDMVVCKCTVPSRHGGTLNSRRAASPLVRLVEGKERWEAPDHPQGVLPQN